MFNPDCRIHLSESDGNTADVTHVALGLSARVVLCLVDSLAGGMTSACRLLLRDLNPNHTVEGARGEHRSC